MSTRVHFYHSRLRGYSRLSFYHYFFPHWCWWFYIYMSHSSQKKKTKQKKEMNIFHLAHISISIFCRSFLFSVDSASYFLVVRHRVYLFFVPEMESSEKKHKKERETTHSFPYVCLRLVSWSSEHTHSVFSLVSRRISSERTKKAHWWKMFSAFIRIWKKKKKKKEGYITESIMAAVALGLKKSEEGEKRKIMFMYICTITCLSRARGLVWLIAITK